MIIVKEVERRGGHFNFFYEPVVVVAYWIVMKEVERRGGDLISFYEPLVVVAYYMIIMKEVALKGEVETFGGWRPFFFFFMSQ
jgi:hypothetical protein|tara:strand:- start:219 stop:467 length:249 start_codon:yes stop_codon:yes gene_type:complete